MENETKITTAGQNANARDDEKYMRRCIQLALNAEGRTYPNPMVGAVVVCDGCIIGEGWHHKAGGPHAEVNAIRDAAKRTGNYDLKGATIYTSCEPCPMCLGAIYWAHISKIFYGNTQADAAAIDFDDSFIYRQMEKPATERAIPQEELLRGEAQETFRAWAQKPDKKEY